MEVRVPPLLASRWGAGTQISSQSASRHPNRGPTHRGLEGLGGDLWVWWSTSGWMQSSHRRQLNSSLLKTPLTALLPYPKICSCLLVLGSLTTHVLLETKHSAGSFSGGQQSSTHKNNTYSWVDVSFTSDRIIYSGSFYLSKMKLEKKKLTKGNISFAHGI